MRAAPRKRLSAEARRESLLAAAQRLFSRKGFFGVGVDEIVAELGVTPAVLYRHFPSKEALYAAVLERIACRREDYVAAIVAEPSDFASVLRRITRIYAESVAKQPDYLRMEMYSVLEGNRAVADFFENRWRPFADFVEVGLRELMDEGRIGPLDERAASLMFQGMLRESLYAKCIQKTARYRDMDLPTVVNRLLDLFFRAIGYAEG